MSKHEAAEKVAQEEFSSVCIEVDHLVNEVRDDGHTVVKTVWSTESAKRSLMSQIQYFKQTDLLHDEGVFEMIHTAGKKAVAIVFHINERQTNIIIDSKVWGDTIQNEDLGGTVLSTIASFIALSADLQKAAREAGELSPILLYVPNEPAED